MITLEQIIESNNYPGHEIRFNHWTGIKAALDNAKQRDHIEQTLQSILHNFTTGDCDYVTQVYVVAEYAMRIDKG